MNEKSYDQDQHEAPEHINELRNMEENGTLQRYRCKRKAEKSRLSQVQHCSSGSNESTPSGDTYFVSRQSTHTNHVRLLTLESMGDTPGFKQMPNGEM